LGADTYSLIGADSHVLYLAPPPAFSSAAMAGEMVELYWQALARDVNFSDYASSPLIQTAATELNQLSDYRGPRDSSNHVTSANIFRGLTAGDLTGPYISQFLYHSVPMNSSLWPQMTRVGMPGVDYVQSYDEWTLYQSGLPPVQTEVFDPTFRYIRNGRDLAQWVHYDFIHQAYQNAALILLNNQPGISPNSSLSLLNNTNPYKTTTVEAGYATFNVAHICAMMGTACMTALQAAWFQKWRVHRRLRPEAMAGRVHNSLTGAAAYPIHPELLNSEAVNQVFENNGTYMLPQAFVEGCPLHPSYPSGHATVGGAGATLLKAFFNEQAAMPNAFVPASDGLSLLLYNGSPLTVGNEANKLAFNVAMGRDWAGIHYRSDAEYGLLLGEQVAIGLLTDAVNCLTEDFAGFQFTKFNGDPISIKPA
jgi:membrane-associated phospholipid phosphatase